MLSNHPRIRVGLYLLAVAAQITAFFVRINSPELGSAFSDSADLLAVIAIGTALTNITPSSTAS